MNGNSQICVVFQATEAGGTISCHLEEIEKIVQESGGASLDEWDISRGVCSITLPEDKNEQWAQTLIEKLNSIEDRHGSPLIDAEMAYASSSTRCGQVYTY
jgi:hypothetical protein